MTKANFMRDHPELTREPNRRELSMRRATAIYLVLIHLGAALAIFPEFFTIRAAVTAVVLYCLILCLGLTMGFHRLLSHRSFRTSLAFESTLAVLGTLGMQGSPAFWVGNHRRHHQCSDKTGDPHSPTRGLWWAHAEWLWGFDPDWDSSRDARSYARDMFRRPIYRVLDRYYLPINLLFAALIFLWAGWPGIVWAFFLRLAVTYQCSWMVNSIGHRYGARRYDTDDRSRNVWWLAPLTFGDSWHNNHHAHPRLACHGHSTWEIDLTYWTLLGLEKLGLVWDIRRLRDLHNGGPADCGDTPGGVSRR
ncbi:MAG: fatty acid desaturase [Planctomycetota bacterium]